jgi:hypothetical protein
MLSSMSAITQDTDRSPPRSPLAILLDEWREGQQAIHICINDHLGFRITDEGSFRQLCDLIERLESVRAIQAGLDDFEAGRTLSLDQFKQHLGDKNGIPS